VVPESTPFAAQVAAETDRSTQVGMKNLDVMIKGQAISRICSTI
jgi:ribosomal protein S11